MRKWIIFVTVISAALLIGVFFGSMGPTSEIEIANPPTPMPTLTPTPTPLPKHKVPEIDKEFLKPHHDKIVPKRPDKLNLTNLIVGKRTDKMPWSAHHWIEEENKKFRKEWESLKPEGTRREIRGTVPNFTIPHAEERSDYSEDEWSSYHGPRGQLIPVGHVASVRQPIPVGQPVQVVHPIPVMHSAPVGRDVISQIEKAAGIE